MKTIIRIIRKVLGCKKTESEMTIDQFILSVQNRRQEFSSLCITVEIEKTNLNNDLEEAGNLILA